MTWERPPPAAVWRSRPSSAQTRTIDDFQELVGSADPRLAELVAGNETIARAIEEAWSARGLLTSRAYLREQAATWRAAHT